MKEKIGKFIGNLISPKYKWANDYIAAPIMWYIIVWNLINVVTEPFTWLFKIVTSWL